jgi:hypothetical protein
MRQHSLLWISVASVAIGGLTTGCNSGPGSFTGTVAGNSLEVKDAIFFTQPITQGTLSLGSGVVLLMSSQTGSCDMLKNNQLKANSTGFGSILGVAGGGLNIESNLTTGSYRILTTTDLLNPPPSGTRLAIPAFEKLDAQCQNSIGTSGDATSGTVNVDSFTNNKTLTGHFDLDFGTDSGTGDFNATFCDYQASTVETTPTCE